MRFPPYDYFQLILVAGIIAVSALLVHKGQPIDVGGIAVLAFGLVIAVAYAARRFRYDRQFWIGKSKAQRSYTFTSSSQLSGKLGPIHGNGPCVIVCELAANLRTFRLDRGPNFSGYWVDSTGVKIPGSREGELTETNRSPPYRLEMETPDEHWIYEIRFSCGSKRPMGVKVTLRVGGRFHNLHLPSQCVIDSVGGLGLP